MSAPSDQPTNVYRDGYTTFTATTTAHGKLLDIRNGDYEEIWDVVGLVKFLAVNFPDAIMAAGWTPPSQPLLHTPMGQTNCSDVL